MFPPDGPVPGDPGVDPGQVNGSPEALNRQPVEPVPQGPAPPTLDDVVREGAIAAVAQARKAAMADDNDAAKAHASAYQSLLEGMAAVAPPMKPIDPQLHASTRGVDPQAALKMRHEAAMQDAKQAHEADMADRQAQQQGGEPSDNGGQSGG